MVTAEGLNSDPLGYDTARSSSCFAPPIRSRGGEGRGEKRHELTQKPTNYVPTKINNEGNAIYIF